MVRWLATSILVLSFGCGGPESPAPEPEPANDVTAPASAPTTTPQSQGQPGSEQPPAPGLGEKIQACTDECIQGRQAEAKAADVIASECAEQCQSQCIEDCVQSRQAEATGPEEIRSSCADGCK